VQTQSADRARRGQRRRRSVRRHRGGAIPRRGHPAARRRHAHQRDQRLVGRRHRREWQVALGATGARVVSVRPAAARAQPDPARRLRASWTRDHHDPHGSRALALRTVVWTRRARPSLSRAPHRSGADRH
jgi:hypothetical protein